MPAGMLLYSLCCDIISQISLKITQAFHLLLGYAENQTIFWDFKIRNGVWISEGSDNGDSDNRGPTVHTRDHTCIQVTHMYSWLILCHNAVSNYICITKQ